MSRPCRCCPGYRPCWTSHSRSTWTRPAHTCTPPNGRVAAQDPGLLLPQALAGATAGLRWFGAASSRTVWLMPGLRVGDRPTWGFTCCTRGRVGRNDRPPARRSDHRGTVRATPTRHYPRMCTHLLRTARVRVVARILGCCGRRVAKIVVSELGLRRRGRPGRSRCGVRRCWLRGSRRGVPEPGGVRGGSSTVVRTRVLH